MEVWNITVGKQEKCVAMPAPDANFPADMLVFESSYDASNVTRNLKVAILILHVFVSI
jgi:hypothetical protein